MLTSESSPSALVCKKSEANFDGKTEKRKVHDLFLEVLDVVLSCAVVSPCVISYWRGTWELMGLLIFPNSVPLSALISFLIGGIGHLFFTMTQSFFKEHIHPDQRRLTYYIISRCYTALFGIVCVNMWRGSWILCDWLTSADSLVIICAVTLVALLFLIATRTVRNLGAAPFIVAMDHKSDYFDVDTMFKIPGFHQPGLFLLDSLFSVFVIGTLVVIAWRGLWGILDLTFYPEDRMTSTWGSLLMGHITALVTFIMRPLVRCICNKMDDGVLKLVICDIFYFGIFFASCNVWRGMFSFYDIYVYPDDKMLSYSICHVVPFFILATIKCSNSILVRGVFIDAENDANGDCVALPINFVKTHFKREREKKAIASMGRHHYLTTKLKDNLDFSRSIIGDKEAQSVLIAKDTAKKPQIQSGMDAGCSLTKHTRDRCIRASITGWVKNSKQGTVVGKMQGPKEQVEKMIKWLTEEGSPGCEIERCAIRNMITLNRLDYKSFDIRF